jgi:hypothetical protein
VRHARAAKKIVLMTDADLPLVMKMTMTWRRDPKKRKAMRRRDPTTTKRKRRDQDARRMTTRRSMRSTKAKQLKVLRIARNKVLSLLRWARDVLKILSSLKKSPRRTVLRMASKSLPRRTRIHLRMSALPKMNPRDLLPRRLLSKRKTTRSTGTSTDPRRKRRDPSTTRVKRGLSVTKKVTKKRKDPHSVRKNHAKTRLLVRMRENSSDYKSNVNVAFIKGSGGL